MAEFVLPSGSPLLPPISPLLPGSPIHRQYAATMAEVIAKIEVFIANSASPSHQGANPVKLSDEELSNYRTSREQKLLSLSPTDPNRTTLEQQVKAANALIAYREGLKEKREELGNSSSRPNIDSAAAYRTDSTLFPAPSASELLEKARAGTPAHLAHLASHHIDTLNKSGHTWSQDTLGKQINAIAAELFALSEKTSTGTSLGTSLDTTLGSIKPILDRADNRWKDAIISRISALNASEHSERLVLPSLRSPNGSTNGDEHPTDAPAIPTRGSSDQQSPNGQLPGLTGGITIRPELKPPLPPLPPLVHPIAKPISSDTELLPPEVNTRPYLGPATTEERGGTSYVGKPLQLPDYSDNLMHSKSPSAGNPPNDTSPEEQTTPKTLSPKQIADLDSFTATLLETAYVHGITSDEVQTVVQPYFKPGQGRSLINAIATGAGIDFSLAQGKYPAALPEATARFMHSLVDFLERKANTPGEEEHTVTFATQVEDIWFSSSVNIANYMDMHSQLALAAKANQLPVIQRSFGGELTAGLIEQLRTLDDSRHLTQWLLKQPVEQTLSILDELQQVVAHAAGAGYGQTAVENIAKVYCELRDRSPYPLVRYTSLQQYTRALQEVTDPTLGVVHRQGDRTQSRLPQSMSESEQLESSQILGAAKISDPFAREPFAQRLSSKHIGIFDHSLHPVATFPAAQLLELQQTRGYDPRIVKRVSNFLYRNSNGELRPMIEAVGYIDKHFGGVALAPEHHQTYQDLSDAAHGIEDMEKTLTASIQKFCENASDKFTFKVEELLHTELASGNTSDFMRNMYQQLHDAENSSLNPDNRINKAESAVSMARIFPEKLSDTLVKSLEMELDRMHSLHRWAWSLQDETEDYSGSSLAGDPAMQRDVNSLYQLAQDADRQYSQTMRLLADRYYGLYGPEFEDIGTDEKENDRIGALHSALLISLENILDQHDSAPEVQPQAIKELANDPNLFPFKGNDLKDKVSQFQRLHQLPTKRYIEAELGIKLDNLPLRSQVHFLSYLVQQDASGFARLKDVLAKQPDSANSILRAFLAHSENPKYAESILSIAERLSPENAKRVFEHYNRITKDADAIADSISTEPSFRSLTPELLQSVSASLIRNANRILQTTAQELSQTGAQKSEQHIEQILARVERAHQDILVTGSILKHLGGSVTLDQVKGATIDVSPASALSVEDKRLFEEVASYNIFTAWYYEQATKEDYFGALQNALADTSPNQQFYALRINGNLTNYLRVEPTAEPDTLYIASFNSVGLQGSGTGRPFFASVVESLGRDHDLTLSYDPQNPAGAMYRELGFQEVEIHSIAGSRRPQIVARRPKTD